MKVSHVALAVAAATAVNAQLNVPKCATSCLLEALSSSTCKDTFDFACQCKQKGLVDTVVPCVEKECEAEDQQATVDAVTKACEAAGSPIEIPPLAGETTGTASTSAVSSEPTESSTKTTDSSETTDASITATTSAEASGSVDPSSSPSGTVTGTDSSETSEPTGSDVPDADNAASGLKASFGGVAAGLLAVAAYF